MENRTLAGRVFEGKVLAFSLQSQHVSEKIWLVFTWVRADFLASVNVLVIQGYVRSSAV